MSPADAASSKQVRVANALHTIGFRSLLIDGAHMPPHAMLALQPLLRDQRRTRLLGRADETSLYLLRSPRPVSESFALLTPARRTPAPAEVAPPETTIEFTFTNEGAASFRHPTFEPIPLLARWHDAGGRVVATSRASGLLPIALAPGDAPTRPLELDVPVPPDGATYRVEIAPADEPDTVVARRDVVVPSAARGTTRARSRAARPGRARRRSCRSSPPAGRRRGTAPARSPPRASPGRA